MRLQKPHEVIDALGIKDGECIDIGAGSTSSEGTWAPRSAVDVSQDMLTHRLQAQASGGPVQMCRPCSLPHSSAAGRVDFALCVFLPTCGTTHAPGGLTRS